MGIESWSTSKIKFVFQTPLSICTNNDSPHMAHVGDIWGVMLWGTIVRAVWISYYDDTWV